MLLTTLSNASSASVVKNLKAAESLRCLDLFIKLNPLGVPSPEANNWFSNRSFEGPLHPTNTQSRITKLQFVAVDSFLCRPVPNTLAQGLYLVKLYSKGSIGLIANKEASPRYTPVGPVSEIKFSCRSVGTARPQPTTKPFSFTLSAAV